MLERYELNQVDSFGRMLDSELARIADEGIWGSEFIYEHTPHCHYSSARQGTRRNPRREKWCQLNDSVFGRAGYSSESEDGIRYYWKVQAKFSAGNPSGLWVKKKPAPETRQPREWSLPGNDVWAISYDALYDALLFYGQEELKNKILNDLQFSWRTIGRQVPVRS